MEVPRKYRRSAIEIQAKDIKPGDMLLVSAMQRDSMWGSVIEVGSPNDGIMRVTVRVPDSRTPSGWYEDSWCFYSDDYRWILAPLGALPDPHIVVAHLVLGKDLVAGDFIYSPFVHKTFMELKHVSRYDKKQSFRYGVFVGGKSVFIYNNETHAVRYSAPEPEPEPEPRLSGPGWVEK